MHETRNPYNRANSLDELLSFDDLDFVRCAYVTILGRQPDERGANYYVERLRRGHSKRQLLWQLRRSTEGRVHDPGIAGLDRALKCADWEQKPIIGALVRAWTGGEADDRITRLQRSLLNELRSMREPPLHAQTSASDVRNLSNRGRGTRSSSGDFKFAVRNVPSVDLPEAAQKSLGILTGAITR
jgi:Domain of unknown function (DUF4214)